MARLVAAAFAALALLVASPALASDCHGDCANCPRAKASAGKAEASKDAPACACSNGGECKCPQGCQCDHCAHRPSKEAPEKAPAKS